MSRLRAGILSRSGNRSPNSDDSRLSIPRTTRDRPPTKKPDLNTLLLEEMLRRKGTTIAKVKRWKKDPPWYTRLCWDTKEEADDYKKWWLRTVGRHERVPQKYAEKSWWAWSLMYGLHPGYLDEER